MAPKKEYLGKRAQEDSHGGVTVVTARTSDEKREEIRTRLAKKATEDRAKKAAKAAEGTVSVGSLDTSGSSPAEVAEAAEEAKKVAATEVVTPVG